jgi:exopolysaccharide biosynthesis polyprenyl glycosylphosphotransferase
MGQLANIIDFQTARRPKVASVAFTAPHVAYSDLQRLIPGASDSVPEGPTCRPLTTIATDILPRFCHRFDASMLAPAMLDVALIILISSLGTWMLGQHSLHWATFGVYVSSFLIFAIEEELYRSQKTALSENAAICRAVGWATLFAGLFLRWPSTRGSGLMLSAFSLCTIGTLVVARQLRRVFRPTEPPLRNVLIVGSEIKAAQVAKAIHRDQNSSRRIKAYITENHLRNNYGPAMLSRIAREEFIDELVIVSSDPSVLDAAVREACKNNLDVKVAPDTCIPVSALGFESLGGLPLFKVKDHQIPEYRLALKRSLDFALAMCGLIALSPVMILTAALIKWDSAGPIFYRALRAGRKGQQFLCYKFRTMVPDAEAVKDELRSRNERQGAFFKIENDPRITRLGRLLRRYSLDELPQLWNVLLGDMSLVGPRPHPLDDVSQYELHHLRRLDFVPGITGLWQVTARRDPSFERNIALDVEYIKNWNLWLDMRILCKTVSAVLAGSGV